MRCSVELLRRGRRLSTGRPRWSLRAVPLLAPLLLVGATGCDRPGSAKPEGAARPLPFEVASAPSSTAPSPELRNVGCVPGAHRCVGEKLEACDPTQGGWAQVNVCQTAAHCNGKLRQCLVDPCILGEHQCDGPELQQCQANGWTTIRNCGSAEACDAAGGFCR